MQHFVEYLRTVKRRRLHLTEPVVTDEIFQVSTIGAVMQGVYDGEMTYEEIARHGDFGVGTFNALDGEMVAFQGHFYQLKSGAIASLVEPWQKTPFVIVTFFKPSMRMLCRPSGIGEICDQIDKNIESRNAFYAVKIDGTFKYLKLRILPRQEKPYRPLPEVLKEQEIYEVQNITGTIAGFRFPKYTGQMSLTGYHLQFINSERSFGGHILDGNIVNGHIELDGSSRFHLELPDEEEFLKADLDRND